MRRAAGLLVLTVTAAAVIWWLAPERIRSLWPSVLRPPSPHERYARALEQANLHDTALGRAWLTSAASVLQQAHTVTLPFSASGTFDPAVPAALAWRFSAVRGRRIEVEVELDVPGSHVFVDLFAASSADMVRIQSAREGETTLSHEPREDGTFVLRVQPELLRGGSYIVRQRAVATLRFPVEGVTARAVQSVFGDARDRGTRSHEGVDIFAPRGTPVIAATDGWVTGVTTNRLGGNVVWVWDTGRGQALYYAHLDRQEVSPGERVRAGDVVGYVGNTGNARGTKPHLHFGIYRPVEGAIDPLPFICDAPCGTRGMAYAR